MTIAKKRLWLIVLAVALVACLSTVGMITAFALTTADTIEYPFRTGGGAFSHAPTVTWTEGDTWFGVSFPAKNLSALNITYVAIQLEVLESTSVTPFFQCGGDRYGTYVGSPSYFVDESGAVIATYNDYWRGTNLTKGQKGMLYIPWDSFGWVSWASAKDLTSSTAFNFESGVAGSVKIGEFGYMADGTFTKLVDLTDGEKKSQYAGSANVTKVFPSELEVVDPVLEADIKYPFHSDEDSLSRNMIWSVPVQSATTNNHRLTISFDAVTNLADAAWIVLQVKAEQGAPGMRFELINKDARMSNTSTTYDGEALYYVNSQNVVTKTSGLHDGGWLDLGYTGALLISVEQMKWISGTAANKNLDSVNAFALTTNGQYNYNWELLIGEVGYYTVNQENVWTYHSLVDLSKEAKVEQYVYTSDIENTGSLKQNCEEPERMVYGDVTLAWTATGKNANQFSVWTGGSMGTAEMVKDSYGDDAVKLTCTGANPEGDKYTATTIADGIKWQWAGKKGVTLWARNDSDIEVSFNLEMDVTNPNHVKPASPNSHNARHNIAQGGSFYLYDVNTGKQTIYMTRPCLTLPKGFEGWVYVPFVDFNQAEWSQNEGVMPRSMFVNDDGTMANGSYVSYLAITVFSGDYTNKPFSINKIGAYETTPMFSSALVNNSDKTIPVLMDLPALPETAEEVK